jgi:hypothetical protein
MRFDPKGAALLWAGSSDAAVRKVTSVMTMAVMFVLIWN